MLGRRCCSPVSERFLRDTSPSVLRTACPRGASIIAARSVLDLILMPTTDRPPPSIPPSSPPITEYDISVVSPQSSVASRGREKRAVAGELLSPQISRLPAPKTPASARSRPRDTSSEYYTAVWGSPYQRTSSPTESAHTAWSELVPSEDHHDSSPLPNFGLEHLVPSRLAPPLSLLAPDPSLLSEPGIEEDNAHTPRSRTKRWVHLPQPSRSEKAHWWSDGSRSVSEEERKRDRRHTRSSISEQVAERQPAHRHKGRDENRTLDQQTFLETLRDNQIDDMSTLFASRWADSPPPQADADEKQLGFDISVGPPPAATQLEEESDAVKVEKEAKETPEATATDGEARPEARGEEANVGKDVNEKNVQDETAPRVRPTHLEPPRLRKRVSWRGKNCIVSLPNLDFDALGLPTPMTFDEIQQRLRRFEDEGYTTRGFDLPDDDSRIEADVHVKPIYPDERQLRVEANQLRPVVMLPDLNKWKAYENFLMEQKLAALGVDIGGDEPPLPAQDMSRQSSAQYPPLPFSPPISTGSVGVGRPGMIRGHSHTMSVASPISPNITPFGHMHRHSTFTGPFGFPQLQQPQPLQQSQPQGIPGPQTFSPQKQFGMQIPPQVGSPAQFAALRQDLSATRGPGSPLSQQMFAQSPIDHNRGMLEDQWRRQHAYSQSVQQPALRMPVPNAFMPQLPSLQQTPVLPELPEEDDEEELEEPEQQLEAVEAPELPAYVPPHKRAHINADVAVPTPTRGHQHNISEGFERDIREAEERHQTYRRDMIEVTEETDDSQQDTKEQSQPLQKTTDEKGPLGQNVPVSEGARGHKKSASRLNVDAPAFSFNPTANFQPASTAFTFGVPPPKSDGAAAHGHVRQTSSGTFNVAAPAFKPAKPLAMPTSDFSFSARGPEFTSNTKAFEAISSNCENQAEDRDKPSIFGKVNIPEIVKPARRSQAVAIVKPAENTAKYNSSNEDKEDAEGRITQSDDRVKRHRMGDTDGDEVPEFAEPTALLPLDESSESVASTVQEEPVGETPIVESIAEEAARAVDTIAGALDDTDLPEAHASEGKRMHGHKASASLSALAKPFEPIAPSSNPAAEVEKTSDEVASASDLEDGEIRDDETPIASPLPREQSFSDMPSLQPPQSSAVYSSTGRIGDVAHPEPSFDEIDAVMRQLNEQMMSTEPPKRTGTVSPLPEFDDHPMEGVTYLPQWSRSDAPSPSPGRLPLPYLNQEDTFFTARDQTPALESGLNGWPRVHRLNKADDAPMSDWSDMLSQPEEQKLHARSTFFDNHIERLLGSVIERRLQPFEEKLESIVNRRTRSSDHHSIKRRSSTVESDADDEDDLPDEQRHRPISRGRDKRVDQIKMAVIEALREQSPRRSQSSYDIADLHSALADMKVSFARAASASLELEDVRAIVEDALSRQSQAVVPIAMDGGRESHKRELSELEGRLNETLAGALEEANHRRAVEEREAEMRRLLRLAEEELHLLRDSSRDDTGRCSAMEEERRELLDRVEEVEDARRDAEQKSKDLTAENEAMQNTLEEYRLSSTKWRQHIDEAKTEREALEVTIANLEQQVRDGRESSSAMRRRLERLHSDMANAAGQLASEKSLWKAREDDYRVRCESLEASQAALARQHHELEEELRLVRAGLNEGSQNKSALDQIRSSNASFEELVCKLQADLAEQQSLAARWERDFHDARESGRAEVQRTRMSLEVDVEAANHHVNIVRAELESELLKARGELETVQMEAETSKARSEHLLEEQDTIRREALRKVNHANSVALDEARSKHEVTLQDLAAQHARALQYAMEDKERSEYILNERLSLSDAKLQHANDRILHLQERLEVTQSAAQAAVMSAQTKSAPVVPATSKIPEKVSPQALRESILVLQEQLQEREARIDRLQNQVDKEGPAKLKERDTEISWLRELLSVRSEDLTELVNTLAKPAFDRDSVRDIAIRIRANLQMEQQEKERFGYGPQMLGGSALARLSNFATPKATSLSSAFNKWRSTMESSSLKAASAVSSPAPVHRRSGTPSKASASAIPPSYLAGLMTPPASNFRSTPSPEATMSLPPPRLQTRSGIKEEASPQDRETTAASSERPTTPLFRPQSYDQDAEDSKVHMTDLEDEIPAEDDDLADDDLDVADSEPPAFRSLEAELGDVEGEVGIAQ